MPVDLEAPNRAGMRLFGDQAQKGNNWTCTPLIGAPFDVDAIFDEAWNSLSIQSIGRGGIAPVATTKPAILVQMRDLPVGFKPKQRDLWLRKATGVTYEAADPQTDGMGCYRILLTKKV